MLNVKIIYNYKNCMGCKVFMEITFLFYMYTKVVITKTIVLCIPLYCILDFIYRYKPIF